MAGSVLKWWNPATSAWETVLVGQQGPVGPTGPAGSPGAPGAGVAAGGVTDDLLVKQSGTNYDTAWQDEITVDRLSFDTAAAETLTAQGEMAWDVDRETVALRLDSALSTYLNQDSLYHVVNQTGVLIPKGTVVRSSGTLGNSGKILIAPFLGDGTFDSQFVMGVTAEDIGNGAEGFVVAFGLLRGVNTNAYVDGDRLWASSTVTGGFTTTAPTAPNNNVLVALVVKAANNGVLFVRPTFGSSLAQDEMVDLAGLVDNDLLVYDSATGVFMPEPYTPLPTGGTTGQVLVKSSATDYDTGWQHPPAPSPLRATSLFMAAPTTTAAGLIQENAVLSGAVVYLPTGTITDIAARVTVVGSAGAVIRLGVYSMSGLSGTLVWDAGTIDGTSATTQTITGGTAAITRGWYALVAALQGAPGTRPTVNRNTGIAPYTFVAQGTADALIAFPPGTGVFEFGVTGAFPSTVTFSVDGSRSQVNTRVAVKGTWT